MAKIYTEQAVSDFATQTYNHQGNAGQYLYEKGSELVQKAEGTEQQAKKQYSQAVQIDWQNSMNDIANNPKFSANPTAMQAEMKKLNDKMAAEIVDDDVKYDFYVNSQLKGQSYLNNATTQFKKNQLEQQKSQAFNDIYAGMDITGLSAMNVLSGAGTEDDIANYALSRQNVLKSINTRNAYGNFVFSDAERLKMENDFDKNVLKSFKAAYDNAPEDLQDIIFDKINSNQTFIVQSKKGPININAGEVVTPSMMMDIKNYVRDAKYKRIAAKEKEYKYNKTVALAEYGANPTKSGLEQLKQQFPDLDTKKLDELEEKYREGRNYMAETQPEAVGIVQDKIDEIVTQETLNEDGTPNFDAQFDKFIDAVSEINKQSTGKDAKLSYEDAQKLIADAAETMYNEDVRMIKANTSFERKSFMSNIADFFSLYSHEKADKLNEEAKERISRDKLSRMTANAVIQRAASVMSDKTLAPEERIRQAKEVYRKGSEALIRVKNPEIGDKQVGDKVTINGITYEIVSFDNHDVQVRVSK